MNLRPYQRDVTINTINTIHCKLMTTTDKQVDTFKTLILTVSKCKLCIWFTLVYSTNKKIKIIFFELRRVYSVNWFTNDLKI